MTVPKTTTTRFEGFSDPTFTPVPDELFDELLATLSGAEVKVLLYIIRRTYGFKKRSDRVSKSQLENGIQRADGSVVDHGTGLSRRAIRLAVDSLVAREVLIKHTHQSAEKGFEATEYSLHRRPEKAHDKERTPDADPWVISTQGLGRGVPRPLGRGVPIQETVEQEKTRQETDYDLSNLRKGARKNLIEERVEERREPAPERAAASDSTPLTEPRAERVGGQASLVQPALPQPPATTAKGVGAESARHAANGPGTNARYSHERQVILAYLRDFASEFHDRAPLKSSVTRALHLFARSGLSLDAFVGKLYEARALTKERDAAIGYQGLQAPRHPSVALRNKTPYFFALLEDVLGLRKASEGEQGIAPTNPPETVPEGNSGVSQRPAERRRPTGVTTVKVEDLARSAPDGTFPATADPAAIWQATLAELEQTVTRPIYDTYLRDTGDAIRASGRLIITAPSDFAVSWLTTKLYPVVSQAAARVMGAPVEVAFVVAPPRVSKRRPPKDRPSSRSK